MWRLWRFLPRRRKWPWRYYAWRLETYTGIPASEVTWRTVLDFVRQKSHRRALRRYARWLGLMQRLRRFLRH